MYSKKIKADAKIVKKKQCLNISQSQDCRILFFSHSEKQQPGNVLKALPDKPMLTLRDINHFAVGGGCIESGIQGDEVVFNENLLSIQRAQLKSGAQLLELGRVVIEK